MALISVSNNALQNITAVPASIPSGALVLLSTQTASASASLSFTSGIDSTYDSYVFKFINIHPQNYQVAFQFNFSADAGSNYNVTKTTTAFRARHTEGGASGGISYETEEDLAQSTAFQNLTFNMDSESDSNISGTLTLFNPSSTTYVKHFIADNNSTYDDGSSQFTLNFFHAGYGNTTSAINAIRFQMSSGNIDDGIIKLYGVK
jgi:hypothetical protein